MTHPSRQHHVDAIVWCWHAADPVSRPHCALTAAIQFGTIALCEPCTRQRSTVGKGQRGITLTPGPPIDLLSWIATAAQEAATADHTLIAAISRARQAGLSWTAIATQLGVSRQAAQQRFARATNPLGLDPRATPHPSSERQR